MIERGYGDLVTSDVDAIVNTVNTAGVMGTGLAAQVRITFPEVFTAYARACKQGEVVVGRMHVVERVARPRYVINFPTKQHWRNPSKIEYIDSGLIARMVSPP
jgi:O-acetyl-ADP-ribose deacetylase (regulator of RNase III)